MVLDLGSRLRYPLAKGVWGLWRDSSAGVWVSWFRGKVVEVWSWSQDHRNHHLILSHSSLLFSERFRYGAQMGASGCTSTPLLMQSLT